MKNVMENENLPSITDVLDKYKDIELEIVFVGDYNIKQRPYYCKVIFHGITDDGMHVDPIAYMVPEQLNEQYMVGTIFKNMKCVKLAYNVRNSTFRIKLAELSKTKKIREVIGKHNTRLIWNYKLEEEFYLNQNCYVLKYKDSRVSTIIPHYVIANYFYFKSSRLKYALLEGRLGELCYLNSFKKESDKHYKIRLKRNLINVERETLCYLLNDEVSKNEYKSFVRYRSSLLNSKLLFSPVQSGFPFSYDGSVNTLFKTIQNDKEDVKHIILHIYDDSFFKFGMIDSTIDKYIKDSDLDDDNIPTIPINKPKDSGKTNNSTPSKKYIRGKRNNFSLSNYRKNSHITHKETSIEIPGQKPRVSTEELFIEVDGSFEDPSADGNDNIQPVEQEPSESNPSTSKQPNNRIFELSEFIEIYNVLKENKDISDCTLSEQKQMNKRTDNLGDVPPRYYKSKDVLRKFFYGYFKYKEKNVAFLELEHSSSWKSISTWFFIFKNGVPDIRFFHEFIYQYLCVCKNLKKVEKEFLELNEIESFSQRHPSTKDIISDMSQEDIGKLKQKEIKRWVTLLTNKIDTKIRVIG